MVEGKRLSLYSLPTEILDMICSLVLPAKDEWLTYKLPRSQASPVNPPGIEQVSTCLREISQRRLSHINTVVVDTAEWVDLTNWDGTAARPSLEPRLDLNQSQLLRLPKRHRKFVFDMTTLPPAITYGAEDIVDMWKNYARPESVVIRIPAVPNEGGVLLHHERPAAFFRTYAEQVFRPVTAYCEANDIELRYT